jgi:hypothetical protein
MQTMMIHTINAELNASQKHENLVNMSDDRTHQQRAASAFSANKATFHTNPASQQPQHQNYDKLATQIHVLPTILPPGSSSPFMMTNNALSDEREGSFLASSSATHTQSKAAFYHHREPVERNAHHPCSCNECAYHYWHNYHYYHGIQMHGQCYTPYTSSSQERPSLRRRVSSDPRQISSHSAYLSRGDYNGESSRLPCMFPGGSGEAIDADQEVEMITSRQIGAPVHPYSRQPYQHCRRHEASERKHLRPYETCLPYGQQHPYHPYPSPYTHPYPRHAYDAYHHERDLNAPYQVTPIRHTSTRKRKQYDEFILRPRKDYIIHADRSASPCSDITSSPTPSLDSFDIPEIQSLCKKIEEPLRITDVPVLELKTVAPRIERHPSRKNSTADFSEPDIVRMVSPIKPKSSDEKSDAELPKNVWRKRDDRVADQFVAISNNISQ